MSIFIKRIVKVKNNKPLYQIDSEGNKIRIRRYFLQKERFPAKNEKMKFIGLMNFNVIINFYQHLLVFNDIF